MELTQTSARQIGTCLLVSTLIVGLSACHKRTRLSKPSGAVDVPSRLLMQKLIFGDLNIRPSWRTWNEMTQRSARPYPSRYRLVVAVCVDRAGYVNGLRVRQPTGFARYDKRVTSAIRTWQFRPSPATV